MHGVVPALDELEHGHACFGLGLKDTPLDQLALRVAKRLGHCGVEAIPGRPGGSQHSHLMAALAEGQRRVLGALFGMMDDLFWTALSDGRVER